MMRLNAATPISTSAPFLRGIGDHIEIFVSFYFIFISFLFFGSLNWDFLSHRNFLSALNLLVCFLRE